MGTTFRFRYITKDGEKVSKETCFAYSKQVFVVDDESKVWKTSKFDPTLDDLIIKRDELHELPNGTLTLEVQLEFNTEEELVKKELPVDAKNEYVLTEQPVRQNDQNTCSDHLKKGEAP